MGNDGPGVLGPPWACLCFFSGVKAIPASSNFLLALANSALSALWAVVVAGVGTFDLIVETVSPKNGERISCWAPNSNDEGRETVPFGSDDCEGGDELGGLLGPRCQSRLSQPDDCSGPITVPRHGAISQFYWGFLEPENVVCG